MSQSHGKKHIPTATWLSAVDLAQYEPLFASFHGLEVFAIQSVLCHSIVPHKPLHSTCVWVYVPYKKGEFLFQDIIDWGDAELKALGVTNNAHRARLVSSIVKLRSKLQSETDKSTAQPSSFRKHLPGTGTGFAQW